MIEPIIVCRTNIEYLCTNRSISFLLNIGRRYTSTPPSAYKILYDPTRIIIHVYMYVVLVRFCPDDHATDAIS